MKYIMEHAVSLAIALAVGGISALIMWLAGVEMRMGSISVVAIAYIAESVTYAKFKGMRQHFIGVIVALVVSAAAVLSMWLTDIDFAIVVVAMAVAEGITEFFTRKNNG